MRHPLELESDRLSTQQAASLAPRELEQSLPDQRPRTFSEALTAAAERRNEARCEKRHAAP